MHRDIALLIIALALAITAAVFDVQQHRIPNWLTYPGIVLGAVLRGVLFGWKGLASAGEGLLLAGGIVFLFYAVRAMGAGDVKLMAAIGSLVGPDQAIVVLLATAICGGVMAIVISIYHGRMGETLRNLGSVLLFHARAGLQAHPELNLDNPTALRMPYGLAIAAGTLYPLLLILWRGVTKTGRLGIALLMALVVSVLVTFFLYKRIKQRLGGGALIKGGPAPKPLDTGTPLAAGDLTLMDWPSNAPLEGAFSKPEDVTGRVVMYPIAFKEPIRDGLLAAPGATVGLTAKIPDGMRAVAVVTNELNNVSGFLFPGSHVDVLVSFRPEADNKEPMTITVLQNVQVLSTGEKLQPDPNGKPQNVKVVTVLLSPDDSQKLLLASNQGTVQ